MINFDLAISDLCYAVSLTTLVQGSVEMPDRIVTGSLQ